MALAYDAHAFGGISAFEDRRTRSRLKIVTFNVFTGSPIPYLWGGTPSLAGSSRLQAQLDAVEALDADVVCLQEIYCDSVLRAYRERFGAEYAFVVEYERRAAGVIAAEVAVLVAALILFGALKGLMYVLLQLLRFEQAGGKDASSLGWNAATFGVLWIILRVALRDTALVTFFNGSVKGFMATMYRMNQCALGHATTTFFNDQQGDIENVFRPRAFQIARLSHLASGQVLTLVHVHTNALGPTSVRRAQVAEAINATKQLSSATVRPDGVTILLGDFNDAEDSDTVRCCSADFGFVDSGVKHGSGDMHTWVRANPLSQGFMRTSDRRCDYIFLLDRNKTLRNVRTRLVFNDLADPISDHYGVLMQCDIGPVIYE